MTVPIRPPASLFDAVPYLVVDGDSIIECSRAVGDELGADPAPLIGPLSAIGAPLDDHGFEALAPGAAVRVRLGAELGDVPVRLRCLATDGDLRWIELRSLAAEFRMESLLRRSGAGHMLLTPDIELLWSMSAHGLNDVFPGDDPLRWIELMDPDDMQELGRAIHAVGRDPNLRRVVRHRLRGDRTHTIIDVVESAVHDPDLRAVLVRSRLEDTALAELSGSTAPYASMTVSDHMPIGVIVATAGGAVLHRNAVAARLIGARASVPIVPDADAEWLLSGLPASQIGDYLAVFAQAVAGSPAFCTLNSTIDPRRWLRVSISPAAASTVVLTVEDTTELVDAERAVRASNRLLEALDSHSAELVIVFDGTGAVRFTSSSVRRQFGATTILQSADFIDVVHLADRALIIDLLRRTQTHPGRSEAVEVRLGPDDEPNHRWHHVTVTNLLDDADVDGIVITLRDVHERHLADRELEFRATHDALTALSDRAAFERAVATRLADPDRYLGVALMFFDVDRFKEINDSLGHRVGDLVLTRLAERLRAATRTAELAARFGGDEFVVLFDEVVDRAHATALAEHLFHSIVGDIELDDRRLGVTVSLGACFAPAGQRCDAERLLQCADAAMYEAKRSGRNTLTVKQLGADDDEPS